MLPCISSAKENMLGVDSTFEQLLYTTVRIEAKDLDFSMDEFKPPLIIKKLYGVINNDKYNIPLSTTNNSIEWLNELLKVPSFYDILCKKSKSSFSKDIMELVNKTKEYRNKSFSKLSEDEKNTIKKLNRLLLEETYPKETPKIQDKNGNVGTGFIFGYEKDNLNYYFLVTNKHVIENSTDGLLRLHYGDGENPVLGKFKDVKISNFEGRWIKHPKEDIDIAIMPFLPVWEEILKGGEQIFFRAAGLNHIPSDEIIKNEIDAVEDIVFIGYPNDVYDKKNFLPLVRKGITATPISVDFEGRPVFLIDASVFSGSSGSPVFICNVGSYSPKGKSLMSGNRLFFVGIVAAVYYREDLNKIEVMEIPTKIIPMVKTRQMVDIGMVYKSAVIVQIIEDFLNIKK